MLHLHLLFIISISIVRFYADTCPEMNTGLFFIIVDNQMFIVLARQLTIYSRRRLIKTSSQNQEVITIKK